MKHLIHNPKQAETTSLAKNDSDKLGYFYRFIDLVGELFTKQNEKDVKLSQMIQTPRRVGMFIMLIFFGIFGLWSVLAPIDGSIISPGQVIVDSNTKIIQHLEGGIIDALFVKEGQYVKSGEKLMHLSDVSIKAQIGILSEKLQLFRASEARLLAESANLSSISFPQDIEEGTEDPLLNKIIENQIALFNVRMMTMNGKIDIMNKRIDQTHNEIKGIKAQLNSANKQCKLIEEDLRSKRELLKSNYISKNHVMPIEKEYADINGRVGEYQALISRAEQKIGETELEIINIKNTFYNEVTNELKEVDTNIAELEQKINALNDVLNRSVIKSPQDGYITGIKYNTIGGIIPPGATIMEIISSDEDMIIETKISPQFIESILTAQNHPENIIIIDDYSGLKTKIRLTAFNSRKVGLLQGVLVYVSASTLVDHSNGTTYYLAHIKIPASEINKIKSDVKMHPGMPVIAYIITESRTLFSYLLSPIVSTFDNAFRER